MTYPFNYPEPLASVVSYDVGVHLRSAKGGPLDR
jgi:hypothetical protein